MAKKGKDSRPTRQKQKGRSVENKKKQLEKHIELYPKDENAKDALAHIRKTGNSRGRKGVFAAIEARKLNELRQTRQDKNNKKKRNKRWNTTSETSSLNTSKMMSS